MVQTVYSGRYPSALTQDVNSGHNSGHKLRTLSTSAALVSHDSSMHSADLGQEVSNARAAEPTRRIFPDVLNPRNAAPAQSQNPEEAREATHMGPRGGTRVPHWGRTGLHVGTGNAGLIQNVFKMYLKCIINVF